MSVQYRTAGIAPAERGRFWEQAVAQAYFPLDLSYRDAERFEGSIELWELGEVSLSRLVTDGITYARNARHLRQDPEEHFLITVPERADIRFMQDGMEVECRPGAFVVERSHLPYEFSDPDANALWVLRVPASLMRQRLSVPDRFASLRFDCAQGAGRLFVDMLRLVPETVEAILPAGRAVLGRQLVDLLALTFDNDAHILESRQASVKQAHLQRIEHYLRQNLAFSRLAPQDVAEACGLSVRYLHQLFQEKGATLGQWVREQRLIRCDEALRDPRQRQTIAEIAHFWGFGDQAQFSRHYKARFGRSPRETRQRGRSMPSSS
ncbi:MAG TPA: helix-turn-helix domain-containing protein [Hypericibacter adhaerens]|uniref:AraC family transcriptional regulator n=1 Tax=Hypericibacter adhaerens TaxID=2602016 RepID=A0A5J6MV98_9PROT|nr:helix-turn-helix domain-containing protein [Hypericibacter adhaerens]QEX21572.1 AraC family transcriptional regulator [Hypericibacter adhaerens]HWA42574.1 helix-turn-helix domain-containing protein [Hypericibacter adhaerens]